jgi:glycerol kinase
MSMEKKYCLAVDQGTTGTRCMIFDHEANKVAVSYLEHKQIYPAPGWVEHDPMQIIDNTFAVIRDSLKKGKIDPKEIASIGVTNQRETIVLWDPENGQPYYNSIVWQDARTAAICQGLKEEYEEPLITPHTGLNMSTYFSAPKVKWVFDKVPNVKERAKLGRVLFGNIDTWIIWWLTGGPKTGSHVTDYTNGSRTMLMDINRLDWDDEIMELFGIPREILPELRPSSDKGLYGYTREDGVFGAELPICGDLGDQQAALVGQVCFEEGETKNTYGTGCFMLSNTGHTPRFSKEGLLTTCAFAFERKKCNYALEGSVAIAGALIQWLRDNLQIISSAPETEKLAESVKGEGSAGVYFVPAFNGLYTPYWDMSARGLICGLTSYTRKEHLVHAALESICWQTRDVFSAISKALGQELESLKVDGGAAVNNYLMQLQSNILGCKVIRPKCSETTSLGAAFAAGLAVGFWDSINDLKRLWKVDRVFEPTWDNEKRRHLLKGWSESVKLTMGWLKKLS